MVTVNDLTDQIGMKGPRPILFCVVCQMEASANAGDYWSLPKDHEFICCDEPMALVIKKTTYEIIKE